LRGFSYLRVFRGRGSGCPLFAAAPPGKRRFSEKIEPPPPEFIRAPPKKGVPLRRKKIFGGGPFGTNRTPKGNGFFFTTAGKYNPGQEVFILAGGLKKKNDTSLIFCARHGRGRKRENTALLQFRDHGFLGGRVRSAFVSVEKNFGYAGIHLTLAGIYANGATGGDKGVSKKGGGRGTTSMRKLPQYIKRGPSLCCSCITTNFRGARGGQEMWRVLCVFLLCLVSAEFKKPRPGQRQVQAEIFFARAFGEKKFLWLKAFLGGGGTEISGGSQPTGQVLRGITAFWRIGGEAKGGKKKRGSPPDGSPDDPSNGQGGTVWPTEKRHQGLRLSLLAGGPAGPFRGIYFRFLPIGGRDPRRQMDWEAGFCSGLSGGGGRGKPYGSTIRDCSVRSERAEMAR